MRDYHKLKVINTIVNNIISQTQGWAEETRVHNVWFQLHKVKKYAQLIYGLRSQETPLGMQWLREYSEGLLEKAGSAQFRELGAAYRVYACGKVFVA